MQPRRCLQARGRKRHLDNDPRVDAGQRYAFGNQPWIAQWNLAQLAQSLLPLLPGGQEKAIEAAQADNMERHRETIAQWPASKRILLPHWEDGSGERAAPSASSGMAAAALVAGVAPALHADSARAQASRIFVRSVG